jgi:hypothetical protein
MYNLTDYTKILKIASDDEFGRKLQDLELLRKN